MLVFALFIAHNRSDADELDISNVTHAMQFSRVKWLLFEIDRDEFSNRVIVYDSWVSVIEK